MFILNDVYKIEQERFVNFSIAVSEALMNAIVHGNKESDGKRVFVDVYESEEEISVIIKDEGCGFDYTSIPDPTTDENLHKDHGRGLYIMKILTDSFECKATDKGTLVKLGISRNHS
ncbi:MAG: ATP-binding protein [Bacteroidetes bacterium]|nr:ATP-binding protein [Bacteroidota bacterium]